MGRKRGPLFMRSDRTRRARVFGTEGRGGVGPGQRLAGGCRRGAVRTGEHQIRRNSGAVASHEQVRSVVANKITGLIAKLSPPRATAEQTLGGLLAQRAVSTTATVRSCTDIPGPPTSSIEHMI